MSQSFGGRPRFYGSSNGSRGGRRPNQSRNRYAKGAYIAPDRYVQAAQAPEEEVTYEPKYAFADFGLDERLLTNVQRHGYATPTPVQDQAIPALVAGRDVVGIANTGTGKTAAFLLPLLNKVLKDKQQGVLILAPTRELALQIADEFKAFSQQLPVSHCLCIGGANIRQQMDRLRKNPHFVIGTPGRIRDLLERGALDMRMFTNVVLDEVDRMLDIGFRKEITFLIDQLPTERQCAFFSATLGGEIDMISRSFLTDPVMIQVKSRETNQHIEQDVVRLQPGQNKVDVLHDMLLQTEFTKVLVFGRTKHGINKLEMTLAKRGLKVTSIHGNKNQGARQRSLQAFKRGQVQALLATDVASRGIDVDDVSHVINFDEPQSYEDYIHRIGRTGRAGKRGKALTFIG